MLAKRPGAEINKQIGVGEVHAGAGFQLWLELGAQGNQRTGVNRYVKVEVRGTGKTFHHTLGHDLLDACEGADRSGGLCRGMGLRNGRWFPESLIHILTGDAPAGTAAPDGSQVHTQVSGGSNRQGSSFGNSSAAQSVHVPCDDASTGTSGGRLA